VPPSIAALREEFSVFIEDSVEGFRKSEHNPQDQEQETHKIGNPKV
jgi:hypothetical protein